MYRISEEFLRTMREKPLTLNVVAGEELLSPEGILSARLEQGCVTGGALTVGSCCGGTFTLEWMGEQAPLPGTELAVSAQDPETEESIPLGVFTVDLLSRETDSGVWTVTARDGVTARLERPCYVGTPVPASGKELLKQIGQAAGVEIQDVAFFPDAAVKLTPDGSGYTGFTCRELVGRIAQLWGTNAVISREGVLEFRWFGETALTADPRQYYESALSLEGEDHKVEMLTCRVCGENGEETVLSAGETGEGLRNGLALDNPWMTEKLLEAVWQKVGSFSFRPGRVRMLGDLRLEPGDLIRICDRSGERYVFPVMEVCHEYDGGFVTVLKAEGLPGEQGSACVTVSEAVSGLTAELARFRTLYTDALAAQSAEIAQLESRLVEAEELRVKLVTSVEELTLLASDLSRNTSLISTDRIERWSGEGEPSADGDCWPVSTFYTYLYCGPEVYCSGESLTGEDCREEYLGAVYRDVLTGSYYRWTAEETGEGYLWVSLTGEEVEERAESLGRIDVEEDGVILTVSTAGETGELRLTAEGAAVKGIFTATAIYCC